MDPKVCTRPPASETPGDTHRSAPSLCPHPGPFLPILLLFCSSPEPCYGTLSDPPGWTGYLSPSQGRDREQVSETALMMQTRHPDRAQAGQMLSLNELCRGEKALWQKVRRMSGRVSEPCREGDRAVRSCLWKGSVGSEQPTALGNHNQHGSPHQPHCSPLFFFFFLSFSPIYLFDTFNDASAD